MTTSVTDDRIKALAEDAAKAAFRDLGSNTATEEVRSYCLGYLAALRSQGKVVNTGDLIALREEVRVQASLKDQYADWEETERMFTAIIGEGD